MTVNASTLVALTVVETLQTVLTAATSAATYSLVFYAKKRIGKGKQKFNPTKLAATVLVGAGLGIVLQFTGAQITKEAIQTQLVAYAGIVALVESGLKFASRVLSQNSGPSSNSGGN